MNTWFSITNHQILTNLAMTNESMTKALLFFLVLYQTINGLVSLADELYHCGASTLLLLYNPH